jgi:hypothetical protein
VLEIITKFLLGVNFMFPKLGISKRVSRFSILIVLFVLLTTSLILQACNGNPDGLEVGDQAPEFSLPSYTGSEVALNDYLGAKPVLLYFHMAKG